MSGISEVATSGPIPVAWHSNGTRCHSRACRNQGVKPHHTEPPARLKYHLDGDECDDTMCRNRGDQDHYLFEEMFSLKPSGAYKFLNNALMNTFKSKHAGCTCYYDTYDAHMDLKADCPYHGDSTIKDRAGTYRPPPDHYSTGAGIDPWAVWDAFDLDRYTANAVKYLLRAGKKDIAPRLDDLKKARDYINKAIEREEKK